jgi:hypothetical protein
MVIRILPLNNQPHDLNKYRYNSNCIKRGQTISKRQILMESWFENWTQADLFAFISAVVGVAALLIGALTASVTVSPVNSIQRRRRYIFSIYAIVLGAILIIGGTLYLRHSKQRAVTIAMNPGTNNNSLSVNITPSPSAPSPQQTSSPEQLAPESVATSNFRISTTNDSSWRYKYCVDGDFSVDVSQSSSSINFNLVNAVINACTESQHDYTRLSKIRLGIWNYSDKEKKKGSSTIWSETLVNETIPLGEDYSIKPFTASIRGKLSPKTSEQTLIIQLVFTSSSGESKVSYFDQDLSFSN